LIAIVGSRGKGMASEESDYDTKVISLYSSRRYLLQKVDYSFHFDTDIDGIDLDGTFSDYTTMPNCSIKTS
jgi:predicted nucleotidyltransferase